MRSLLAVDERCMSRRGTVRRSSCRVQRTSDPCILLRTSAPAWLITLPSAPYRRWACIHFALLLLATLGPSRRAHSRLGKLGPCWTAPLRIARTGRSDLHFEMDFRSDREPGSWELSLDATLAGCSWPLRRGIIFFPRWAVSFRYTGCTEIRNASRKETNY